MKPVKSPVSRRGFTLIEVMVSTAIMIVIVLAVVTIASDTFKAYDRAVADLTTQSEARGVLDAMEGDFQSAMIRPDGRCWMEVVIPGTPRAPTGATTKATIGDIQSADQPIIMLFASPPDRPRWSPSATSPRVALKGDVCAISYRIGQSSPFDAPGDPIQQVYGVYRTIIDPENTFKDAIPLIMTSTAAAPISPWDYWNAKRSFANYTDMVVENRSLIDFTQYTTITGTPVCWTLDQSNFIASNVVAMNFTFWCTSSLPEAPTTKVANVRYDPLNRPAQMLRPVIVETTDATYKFSASGYPAIFKAGTSNTGDSNAAPLRYTDNTGSAASSSKIQPFDSFTGRLRIYSDRIYPDALTPTLTPGTSTLPYLPYTLKAIEVSITVLTPEGSKELRALQKLDGTQGTQGVTLKTNASYRRIVNQYGRNYTRYIKLLGNGGG
jgi:type II secretory pathway pseudopilin PulG